MELIIIIPFGIILLFYVLAVGGVTLIAQNLYGIILGISVLIGLGILTNEIRNAISKSRKIYILNGVLGLIFSIFGFELLYEAISLAEGEVHLFNTTIIYIILMAILMGIMRCSHERDEAEYKKFAAVHCMLVVALILIIPLIGTKAHARSIVAVGFQ